MSHNYDVNNFIDYTIKNKLILKDKKGLIKYSLSQKKVW